MKNGEREQTESADRPATEFPRYCCSVAFGAAPMRSHDESPTMYLIAFPLLLIPFALYNMIIFLLNMPVTDTVFVIPLAAGRRLPVTTGDLLLAIAMLLLYVEVLKAARFGGKSAMDHVLAFVLFAGMAAELVLVPQAASPTLLLLGGLAFIDVLTGLSLAVRPKRREIWVEDAERA